MRHIYKPRGAALEYAPWALNHYIGCQHGCAYCYGPRSLRMSRKAYFDVRVKGGDPDLLVNDIRLDADFIGKERPAGEYVHLSFASDPYPEWDRYLRLTRRVIKAINHAGVPVSILTKAGEKSLADLSLLAKFKENRYGITLTGRPDLEPGAAPEPERIAVLKSAHEAGIYTWISAEPLLSAGRVLGLLEVIGPYVNEIRIGALNHMRMEGADVDIEYLSRGLKEIKEAHPAIKIYIKKSLENLVKNC